MSQVFFKEMTLKQMTKSSDAIVLVKFLKIGKNPNPFDRFQVSKIIKQSGSALNTGDSIEVHSAGYCDGLRTNRAYREKGIMISRIINSFGPDKKNKLVTGKNYTIYLKNSCGENEWEFTAAGGFQEVLSMKKLIDRLLVTSGQEYLDKEKLLRQGGDEAISALKTRLKDKDVFTRFYARTMLNWIEGRAPFNDKALDFLDTLPEKIKRTPIPNPSPTGTAHALNLYYQSTLTDILAVHLIKRPDFPYWRTTTILFYLEKQKSSEVTDILLRFITETKKEYFRELTLSIIDATKDPKLHAKIGQEQKRLKSLGLSLPLSLKKRLSKP